MDGSMMFLVYKAQNPSGITLSPRLASGNVEPTYAPQIRASLAPSPDFPNGISNGQYYVSAICRNCTNLSRPPIDLNSVAQAFNFAAGPSGSAHHISSDALDASIRRHSYYGTFTMDMTKATSQGHNDSSGPLLGTQSVGSSSTKEGGVKSDFDWPSIGHAALMWLAFVFVFPLGVFALRGLQKVMWHGWIQGAAVVITILGAGMGFYLGPMYNRSKQFSSAHQILGLLVVVLMIVQFAIGFLHHRIYVTTKRITQRIKYHRFLFGPGVLALGLVNGILGFIFALNRYLVVPYVVNFCVVYLIFGGATLFMVMRRRHTVYPRPSASESSSREAFALQGEGFLLDTMHPKPTSTR